MMQTLLKDKRREKWKLEKNLQPIIEIGVGPAARVAQGAHLGRRDPPRWPRMGITQRRIAANLGLVADLHHAAHVEVADRLVLDGAGLEVDPNEIQHPRGKALPQIMQCTLKALHLLCRRTMLITKHNLQL